MILSFRDKATEAVFRGQRPRRFPADLFRRARNKLLVLNAATTLATLAALPGNRLEPLMGDRIGQHSIRVNDQFRICFRWTETGARDVEFADYH